MTITAKCTPKYLFTASALMKYLQIGLAIVVSIFAASKLCYENYVQADNKFCQSVFDPLSDVHGQAFIVVIAAVMAVATSIFFLARLLDVGNIEYETNWRSVELFFNGVGFSVFALIGSLETWYIFGYYAGADYISALITQTNWTIAAGCAFGNAVLHLLTMLCVGLTSKKN